ncbi:hypothetical protein BH23CHL8_BH23CHL8_18890 [soil metagenome]
MPTAADLEADFGHPGDRWEELQERVQAEGLTEFRSIVDEWLAVLWCLDQYRIAGVCPRGMGRDTIGEPSRLAAVYRNKGNWFSSLIALLIQNTTHQEIRARIRVQGMSQVHQIDVAWPAREEDVLVCAETKVTGAPAYGATPERGAMSDFTNRRKELKFSATDLKLYRRDQKTEIEHWGTWRESAPPRTYFLWAARLRSGRKADRIDRLVEEAQALVNTYLDGAGILAWRLRSDGTGYERVTPPHSADVTEIDDVLYRIGTVIRRELKPTGRPPDPVKPEEKAVDVTRLEPDVPDSAG